MEMKIERHLNIWGNHSHIAIEFLRDGKTFVRAGRLFPELSYRLFLYNLYRAHHKVPYPIHTSVESPRNYASVPELLGNAFREWEVEKDIKVAL